MIGGQDHSGDAVRQLLAEISAEADAATPAAWFEASRDGDDETWWLWAIENDGQPIPIARFVVRENDEEDARLAASSRSSVPRLVAALTAVLDKHQPEKRYQPSPDCCYSYDTPVDAARSEGIDVSAVTYFEVCAHCGRIEMDGETDRDYRESLWPCATYRAVAAALEEQP